MPQAAVADGDADRVDKALDWGRENEAGGCGGLEQLLRDPAASDVVHAAARRGHAEILARLLRAGADAEAGMGGRRD